MTFRLCYAITALVFAGVFNCAGAQEQHDLKGAGYRPLTSAETSAFGNRAEFFEQLPSVVRPDADFRKVLSPPFADAEPAWSQGFEEVVIRDFFGDRRGGTFIDVGCHVARHGSTTYYLEKELGWRGIGVDALDRFRADWKAHRPNSTFVHAAVSDKDGEVLKLNVAWSTSSFDGEKLKESGFRGPHRVVEVTTKTLDTILDEEGVERFDFLSMDIEGAELAALKGFSIQRFKPELCCVETTKLDEVTAYFESNGYEPIEKYLKADKINVYFKRKSVE